MKALHNKIAIVTGAAAGFGEGIARLFVAEGAQVLLADLDLERAQAVAASLGPAAYAVRCDVSRAQDVEAAVQACVQQFGIPQVVVNKVVSLGGTVVMLYLLHPEQYGIASLATSLLAAVTLLAPFTLSDVLLSRPKEVDRMMGTALPPETT